LRGEAAKCKEDGVLQNGFPPFFFCHPSVFLFSSPFPLPGLDRTIPKHLNDKSFVGFQVEGVGKCMTMQHEEQKKDLAFFNWISGSGGFFLFDFSLFFFRRKAREIFFSEKVREEFFFFAKQRLEFFFFDLDDD